MTKMISLIVLLTIVGSIFSLNLVTEDYPPISFDNDGVPDGLAVEIVREITNRIGHHQNIKIQPWARSFKQTEQGPDYVLFGTSRIPERENKFQWVGPIASIKANFYIKKGSGVKISSMEEAMMIKKIGVLKEGFAEQFLLSYGFNNLDSSDNNSTSIKKLLGGRIPIATGENLTMQAQVEAVGYKLSDLEVAYTFNTNDIYLAFSKQVSKEEIAKWAKALNEMKADGTFEKIYKKWLPNEAVIK